jgi:hypothetical protein
MEEAIDALYQRYKTYGYVRDEDVDLLKKVYNELHPKSSNPIKYVQSTT